MTKRTKRIVAAFLAAITALTAFPMSALATSSIGSDSGNISVGEDTVQNAKTTYEQVTEGNAKTRVYLTVNDSDLVVSVPTTIIVSGTPDKNGDYIGKYSVKVSGDMAGSKSVTVKPENEFIALKQAGKSDVSAKINQNKTLFDSADFKKSTITNGKVTANKLTAGSWKATTNFIISTEDLSKPVYQASNGYSSGYIEKTSIVPSNTFSHTEKISVEPGQLYSFSYPSCTKCLTTYDKNGEAMRTFLAPQLKTDIGNSYCGNPSDHNDYDYESGYVTIPNNVYYISFNVKTTLLTSNAFFVFKGEYPLSTHTYTSSLDDASNNLKGKSVVFYGDSICEGVYSSRESFAQYIAQGNAMSVRNKAVSGSQSDKILSNITQFADTSDYVIVEGFINDCADLNFTITPIGTLTPAGTTTFDTSTFIGRLENAIYNYQQGNHKAKLGFVLTYEDVNTVSKNVSVREYWNAAISVFDKYGVSYLDLGNKSYSLIDGLHPNFEGQFQMAADIEKWMNTL